MAQDQDINLPQFYTVKDVMVLCGLNDKDQYNGKPPAERFAKDIFSNSFNMCLDKSVEEVNNDIKQYVTLTQNQGQIRIHPGTRQNVQPIMQWTRDMIRTGMEWNHH